MEIRIENSWKEALKEEFEKPYFKNLVAFVKKEYTNKVVYPAPKDIFRAFDHCPIAKVKVVILGQDPYHGPNQANGLCFSVQKDIKIPPSLRNIYKELHADIGKEIPQDGELIHWSDQGVLLLNATLTVEAQKAGSHQKKGWEYFTDAVIQKIAKHNKNVVFILWGAYAQKKGAFIDDCQHLILKSVHPSPLSASRGYFGNHHFSKTNEYLTKKGKSPINW